MASVPNPSYCNPDGSVRYGSLTTADIAAIGLDTGTAAMDWLVSKKLTTRVPRLHMRAAMALGVDDDTLSEIGERPYSPDSEEFAPYTSLDSGKLATVNDYAADTDDVAANYQTGYDPDDPRGWTGGVHDVGRAEIDGKWITKSFGAACSGIEGQGDRFVAKAIAAAMVAAWVSDTEARHAAKQSAAADTTD